MHSTRPTVRWWSRWLGARRAERAATRPQVRVVRWGAGPRLAPVVVRANRPIRLIFERLDHSCATDVVAIPALGWMTTLGCGPRSCIALAPCAAGTYEFASLDGALRGRLVVEP